MKSSWRGLLEEGMMPSGGGHINADRISYEFFKEHV